MTTADPGAWLERWLSAPRLATYLSAAGQDRRLALELYEWNTAVSAAILHDLAHVEVAVRNAHDAALTTGAPPGAAHWTQQPTRYFPPALKTAKDGSVHDANQRPREQVAAAIRAAGRSALPGKVIAELTFGFWRYLTISARETTLWLPYLRHGFVPGTGRRAVDVPMDRLHLLRNRVAHHEPLLTANLDVRYMDTVTLAGRISPDLGAYVSAHSSWPAVVAQRP